MVKEEHPSMQKGATKTKLAQKRTELAEDRTSWAHDRTMLAKQRTYAAWVRTGLAALTVGFVGAELLTELDPQWLIRSAGGTLILTAVVIFVAGYRGYADTFRNVERVEVTSTSYRMVTLITALLVLISMAGFFLILIN